jgi:hypothetical protein
VREAVECLEAEGREVTSLAVSELARFSRTHCRRVMTRLGIALTGRRGGGR